jgi:ligand-binding sensor domain-containing protein
VDATAGLVRWTGTRFEPFAGNVPSRSRGAWGGLLRLDSGATWYLDASGAHKFDGRRVTRHIPVDANSKWVFEDRHGRVWIEGEERGRRVLLLFEDEKLRRLTAADGVPAFRTMSVVADRRGNVWIATRGEGGLLRYSGGRFTRYSTADGLPSNNVSRVLEDREGNIWVPTEGGLAGSPTAS